MNPSCTRMYTHPFFEATPPGAAPGPPVNTGARVRHFRGCNESAAIIKIKSDKGARSHSAAMYFYPLGRFCCAEMWGRSLGPSPHLNTQSPPSPLHPPCNCTWPSGSEGLAVDDVPREDLPSVPLSYLGRPPPRQQRREHPCQRVGGTLGARRRRRAAAQKHSGHVEKPMGTNQDRES